MDGWGVDWTWGLAAGHISWPVVQRAQRMWPSDSLPPCPLRTSDRKWGQAYLTRDFFSQLGERMADRVLLVLAETAQGEPVAGALNLIGSHALFGRNWGCKFGDRVPNLHFEVGRAWVVCERGGVWTGRGWSGVWVLHAAAKCRRRAASLPGSASTRLPVQPTAPQLCYYQALEFAIERGLQRVEAGAQGEHKIQRGYVPSLTFSLHYLTDPGFSGAVERFLTQERAEMEYTLRVLQSEVSPYKQQGA